MSDATSAASRTAGGALHGLRIVEFAGIGPGPFAAMLLADMGADVVRVDRPGFKGDPRDITLRSRPVVALDLKQERGREDALALVDRADALLEGFRPGVMERLGLGPEVLLARNPRLVYGRITGWGQEGPLAQAAGHDINYIALPGALAAIGPMAHPVPPLNLVGDYGGGAPYFPPGVLAAVIEARTSGRGQVVDAAMCDGAASMLALFYTLKARGQWEDRQRSHNMLDGGAPFYRTYECADGRHVSIGALEPQFYETLCRLAGLDDPAYRARADKAAWPDLSRRMEAVFKSKTRDEWCAVLEGSDACFAPVLTMSEAPSHPHLAGRKTFVDLDGVMQPAPAPRFLRTPSGIKSPPAAAPSTVADVLAGWCAPKAG